MDNKKYRQAKQDAKKMDYSSLIEHFAIAIDEKWAEESRQALKEELYKRIKK